MEATNFPPQDNSITLKNNTLFTAKNVFSYQNVLAIQQWNNPILFVYLRFKGGGGDVCFGSWFRRLSVYSRRVVEFRDLCQLKHIVGVLPGGSQVTAHSVYLLPKRVPQIPQLFVLSYETYDFSPCNPLSLPT